MTQQLPLNQPHNLPDLLLKAQGLQQQGGLQEAASLFNHILQLAPDYVPALNAYAALALQQKDLVLSEILLQRSLGTDPLQAKLCYEYAGLLASQQRYHQALRLYDRALAIEPQSVPAWCDKAVVLTQLKKYPEALACYENILTNMGSSPEFIYNHAKLLQFNARPQEALKQFDRCLSLNPAFKMAYLEKANTLKSLGQQKAALDCYDIVLQQDPQFVLALYNKANLLDEFKRYVEALEYYDKALACQPDYSKAWLNRGNVLDKQGHLQAALASYDHALAIEPNYIEAILNRGNVLEKLKHYSQALEAYDKALLIRPDYLDALTNRGNTLQKLHQFEAAQENYQRVLHIDPQHSFARLNSAMCYLVQGELEKGWEGYEARWDTPSLLPFKRNYKQPRWYGQVSLQEKRLLVYAEQGAGDNIQFLRYLPLLAQQGIQLILDLPVNLHRLAQSLPSTYHLCEIGGPIPAFDYHCPLLSLPLAFNTRLDTIPGQVPYLKATKQQLEKWQQLLNQRLGKGLQPQKRARIGVVWSGNPEHTNDFNRSIPLNELAVLFEYDADFICVQREFKDSDKPYLNQFPRLYCFADELTDFSETAALIECLDILISVDTSVIHLAGALAKPVWMLLPVWPDWRWMLARSDTPWYPTIQLFRQGSDAQWAGVIAKVNQQLREFLTTINK